MKSIAFRVLVTAVLPCIGLVACGGSNNGTTSSQGGVTPAACAEIGVDAKYACQTGQTEPLYLYQWAVKQATSYFAKFGLIADGSTDVNAEDVHKIGVKGQGVNVLVLDDGVDATHEDLVANLNRSMSYNFDNQSNDPTPPDTRANTDAAHGTNVAGMIAAAQNGKGVMGIAPRVTLGGANYLAPTGHDSLMSYGGAAWSKDAHVINASYGGTPPVPVAYDTATTGQPSVRAFPKLRGGRGLIMVKSAGNSYIEIPADTDNKTPRRVCPSVGNVTGMLTCENPANDIENLEPGIMVVAAATAKGVRSSYSSAGSVNWVTGLGGEYGEGGLFGEIGTGPMVFSTDLTGCLRGYSRGGLTNPTNDFTNPGTATNQQYNSKCDYSSMNGTSAAAPTVTGVVALMLSANPSLTWRDVREILLLTAKKIDAGYGAASNRNVKIDLTNGAATTDTTSTLINGASSARLDLGWQKNGAGYDYSNWYGFGLVDASAAVKMAKAYTNYKPAALTVPDFTPAFPDISQFTYGKVQKLGSFTLTGPGKVDALQLRLSGSLCIGSVGVFVKSPAGTVSALALPYNSYYTSNIASVSKYGLGSYAFYGESVQGVWEVYAVNAIPDAACSSYTPDATGVTTLATPLSVEYRVIATQ